LNLAHRSKIEIFNRGQVCTDAIGDSTSTFQRVEQQRSSGRRSIFFAAVIFSEKGEQNGGLFLIPRSQGNKRSTDAVDRIGPVIIFGASWNLEERHVGTQVTEMGMLGQEHAPGRSANALGADHQLEILGVTVIECDRHAFAIIFKMGDKCPHAIFAIVFRGVENDTGEIASQNLEIGGQTSQRTLRKRRKHLTGGIKIFLTLLQRIFSLDRFGKPHHLDDLLPGSFDVYVLTAIPEGFCFFDHDDGIAVLA
jgi:hypothetical protein